MILTMSGSHYRIDEDEESVLRQTGSGQMFNTKRGVRVLTTTISEIIPLEEYYRAHPKERPDNINYSIKNTSELPKPIGSMSAERKKIAIESLTRAFKKHFEGRKIPIVALDLHDKMITRLSS